MADTKRSIPQWWIKYHKRWNDKRALAMSLRGAESMVPHKDFCGSANEDKLDHFDDIGGGGTKNKRIAIKQMRQFQKRMARKLAKEED